MAYNLSDRFPPSPSAYKIFEPGAYQNDDSFKIKRNKAPFLSNTPRKTQPGGRIWTHATYNANIPSKIPNCTAMFSKRPRFPYEALSKEDIENILCRCGIDNVCECREYNEQEIEINCQAKVHRRLYKGHPPRSVFGEGLSAPSKKDHGYNVLPDGSQKRLLSTVKEESPAFYNAKVVEATAFYQGCKWSRWTSSRSIKNQEEKPGPADYTLDRKPTEAEICAEMVRFHRRKHSKQLRFIEMVQQKNILEERPGPATYSPQLPSGMDLQYLGPKDKRFTNSNEQRPGPADHWIRGTFDLPEPPLVPCHARLPEPSFFGVKALRFKPRREEGPSPATYSTSFKECLFMHCPTAPFSSSSVRFKELPFEKDEEEFEMAEDEPERDRKQKMDLICPTPTWEFKSKTIRMKPLIKNLNEPSPGDLPQANIIVKRSPQLQFIAPFYTSEGRFQPWNDWMSVFGRLYTPGPGSYKIEKPKCPPAVCHGPINRSQRFPSVKYQTPGPNEYEVGGGIESILATHNQKLKYNIDNQHKFHWEPPVEPRKLNIEERESSLLQQSIALLEVDFDTEHRSKSVAVKVSNDIQDKKKPKLLRCFLFNQQTPSFF